MAIDTAPTRSASSPTPESRKTPAGRPSMAHRVNVWVRRHLIAVLAFLGLSYLFLPIAVVVIFSFNALQPNGRPSVAWQGFTTAAWTNICVDENICPAVVSSLKIGFFATVVGTLLGTLIAFALVRHRFRGRTATNLTIFLPMATPEVVMGSSLLVLFLNVGRPLGFVTVLIAHIMFTISFVVVTVKARLAGLDPKLEQAAMDLYADERQTFRYITLPLVAPGIAAAALLAFSLSFDDFIITYFNKGPSLTTFPVYVWAAAGRGVPPQVNVIGSLMFFGALGLVVMSQLVGRVRRR